MKIVKAVTVAMLFLSLLMVSFGQAFGEERVSTRPSAIDKPPSGTGDPDKDNKCDQIAEPDERNLCRAFTRDEFNSDQAKQNRYQNKDHSYYYCTLIKDRDKQTYCYAVVRNQKSMCGNIISADLEKECNSKVK